MKRSLVVLLVALCGGQTSVACSGSDDDPGVKRANAAADDDADDDDGGSSVDGAAPVDGASTDAKVIEDAPSVDPGKLFGFVGSADGKVRVYAVDAQGATWTLLKENTVGGSPSFLAYDPGRGRVVATDESGNKIRSLAFDSTTGVLTEKDNKASGGGGPTHVAIDPTGAWTMVANYGGGTASLYGIDADGALTAPVAITSGSKTHWVGTDASGSHVFVVSLGTERVNQYTLDKGAAKLVDNGAVTLAGGTGPRHLAFSPDEKHAWSVNELGVSVTSYDYVAATGKLSQKQTIRAVPEGTNLGGVSGAEIAVHRSGKFVYASTRGYNSIAVFTVADPAGTLTLVQNVDTGGNRPRSFAMDPEGTVLFAGNEARNEVVGFRVDVTTGRLTSVGKTIDVASPTYVGIARFPVR